MKRAFSRGRLLIITLGGLTCLAATGCTGLTNIQLSTILQTAVTTGLTSLFEAIIASATGVVIPTTTV